MAPKKRARDQPPADPLAPDVLLIVGPERVELQAHAHSLCTASEFFKSALHGGLQESATHTIELPDYDVDDIKLLIAVLAYEAFIEPGNVARLARLFNRLSCSAALMKKAEDVITTTIENLGVEELALPGIDSENAEERDRYVELVKLAIDANFTKLLKKEEADGTMGDGEFMAYLRDQIKRHGSLIWPKLGELADFRYSECFSSLWPDIRKVILSPEQLESDDMKEPPSAEVAGYMWPALVRSTKTRYALEMTTYDQRKIMRELHKTGLRPGGDQLQQQRDAFDQVEIKFSISVQKRTPGLMLR
jgi:hypothetical protein